MILFIIKLKTIKNIKTVLCYLNPEFEFDYLFTDDEYVKHGTYGFITIFLIFIVLKKIIMIVDLNYIIKGSVMKIYSLYSL